MKTLAIDSIEPLTHYDIAGDLSLGSCDSCDKQDVDVIEVVVNDEDQLDMCISCYSMASDRLYN